MKTATKERVVKSPDGVRYTVVKENNAPGNKQFQVYTCIAIDDKPTTTHLIKVARTPECNTLLDDEVCLLRLIRSESDMVNEACPEKDGEAGINYHLGVPEVTDTFIAKGRRARRVTVLNFANQVESTDDLIPLSHIVHEDGNRIDQKTSVWIIGKMLKLLDFFQHFRITNVRYSSSNIFINPVTHVVTVFNWLGAVQSRKAIPLEKCKEEISHMTKAVVNTLGGRGFHSLPLEDGEDRSDEYKALVEQLVKGEGFSSAGVAHRLFYRKVESVWERGFHPFTTYSLKG